MKKICQGIESLVKLCSILCLISMILIVLLQVATRWLPVTTPTWTDELSRFLMVFMVCLGGIIAMNTVDGFVRVDILLGIFPRKTAFVLEIINKILMLGLLILIFEPAITLMQVRSRQVSPAMQISMGIPQSAIFIWIVGALLILAKDIFRKFSELKMEGN